MICPRSCWVCVEAGSLLVVLGPQALLFNFCLLCPQPPLSIVGVGPALPGPPLSKHLFLLDLEETCPLVQTMPSLSSEPTTHSQDEPGSLLEKALVLNSSQVLCKQTSDRCLPDSVPTVRSRGALMSGSRRLPISMAYLGPAHSCCPQPGWVSGRAPRRLQPTVHHGLATQQAFTQRAASGFESQALGLAGRHVNQCCQRDRSVLRGWGGRRQGRGC